MSTYVPAWKGYIADVPQLWFKRCDGNVYHFDELTQANVQPDQSMIEINAGHSLYPVAYLPGQSTMTIDITSGQFDADLFAMANNAEFEDAQIDNPEDNEITAYVEAGGSATFIQIYFPGTAHASNLTAQFYTPEGEPFGDPVTFIDDGTNATRQAFAASIGRLFGATVISTFLPSANIGCSMGSNAALRDYIGYYAVAKQYGKNVNGKVAKFDNKSVAMGEAVLKWPVYASGDDCTESSIKGYLIIRMYRARITQMPGFDTSYKSAATFQFQLSAMDPKRDDGTIYDMFYTENDQGATDVVQINGITLINNNGEYTVSGTPEEDTGAVFLLNGVNGIVGVKQSDIPAGQTDPFADVEKIDPNAGDTFDIQYSCAETGTTDGGWLLYATPNGLDEVVDYWEPGTPSISNASYSNIPDDTQIIVVILGQCDALDFSMSFT